VGKRIAMFLSEEALEIFERLLASANDGFEAGRITPSDLMSELVLSSRLDIKAIQLKHSDLRRSLRALSNREKIDIDTAIKVLLEMKGRTPRKRVGAHELEAE
jgi:hypothetical protein